MKFEPKSTGGNGSFVKLESGGFIKGVFRGDPFDYRQHWVNNRSSVCPGKEFCELCKNENESSFRFRINLVGNENGVFTAKIFEGSWGTFEKLKSLHEEYNLEQTIVKITRSGTGNKTKYEIMPVAKGEVSQEMEHVISQVELNDLTKFKKSNDESEPAPFSDTGFSAS